MMDGWMDGWVDKVPEVHKKPSSLSMKTLFCRSEWAENRKRLFKMGRKSHEKFQKRKVDKIG